MLRNSLHRIPVGVVRLCAVLVCLLGNAISSAAEEETLYVVGSTTVTGLVTATAGPFQKKTGIKVVVRPIGTSKGIVAIAEGVADIGMASRYLESSEFEKWPFIRQVTIGQDALAVIVNKANPIDNLSVDQLAAIYSGRLRDWKLLAGDATLAGMGKTSTIELFSKAQGHGTFDAFVSLVGLDAMNEPHERKLYFKLNGQNHLYSKVGAAVFDQANQAVANVQRLPNAIAYESMGALTDLEQAKFATEVKPIRIDGIKASVESASTGSYPLVRPLNLLFNRDSASKKVHLYLDYVLSQEGQQIVLDRQYIPIR